MVLEISLTKECYELQKDGQKDGPMDERTGVNQYTPHFFKAGV